MTPFLNFELTRKRRLTPPDLDALLEIGTEELREIRYLRTLPRTLATDRRIERHRRRWDLIGLIICARSDFIVERVPSKKWAYALKEKVTAEEIAALDQIEAEEDQIAGRINWAGLSGEGGRQ